MNYSDYQYDEDYIHDKEEAITEQGEDMKDEKIREASNEIDDGQFEVWKDANESDVEESFIEEKVSEFKEGIMKRHSFEFEDYCKERWEESK